MTPWPAKTGQGRGTGERRMDCFAFLRLVGTWVARLRVIGLFSPSAGSQGLFSTDPDEIGETSPGPSTRPIRFGVIACRWSRATGFFVHATIISNSMGRGGQSWQWNTWWFCSHASVAC
jgi:hypothetical protein